MIEYTYIDINEMAMDNIFEVFHKIFRIIYHLIYFNPFKVFCVFTKYLKQFIIIIVYKAIHKYKNIYSQIRVLNR